MNDIIYKRASTEQELYQILELQKRNIPISISETEKQQEGFVTVQHTFEVLKAMNDVCAHTIATHEDMVIGYALSMVKAFKDDIDVLKPMFDMIETQVKPTENYIVMGQICIDKNYRKQGVFRGLYGKMKEVLKQEYNCIITEVDKMNQRSLNAHYAVGFKTLHMFHSNNQEWEILICDIN
ncbi:Acetyltransferase (GNAT) family protein [Flaviramulus basaltis]|uniref:Acetyltransferase (GNAT) family protein n=1 Tax=Flaviramulus basaltis TaxID=369401 RepID=A0A1K2IBQ6_9FLAO|nr:GNAT family N-acetyltransferase [Flaviramulus basaltis]SFZ89831.1 Acetyltransferase (GNAT) family protein [Flaviramulus basaltis]